MEAKQVIVTVINNPFDPHGSRIVKRLNWVEGMNLKSCVAAHFPLVTNDFEYVISLNGCEAMTQDEISDSSVRPGDSIAICPVVHGGGGGKILGMVAMVAVMVFAWYAGPILANMYAYGGVVAGAGTFSGAAAMAANGVVAAGASLFSGAIMVAGGMLVSAIMPTAKPTLPSFSGIDENTSQTYGFEAGQNELRQGTVLPVGYGRYLCTPPVISKYIYTEGDDQYLNILLFIADHYVDTFHALQINDSPSYYFDNIETETRNGALDQTVIPYFNNTYTEFPSGAVMNYEETITEEQTKIKTTVTRIVHNGTAENNYETTYEYVTTEEEYTEEVEIGTDYNWVTVETSGGITEMLGFAVQFPYGLYYSNNEGKMVEQTVAFEAQFRKDKGEWQSMGTYKVTSDEQSPVNRFFEYDGELEPGQYDIRVRKAEGPPEKVRYMHQCVLDYVRTGVPDDFRYPGCALYGVRALATDQLNGSQPTFTVEFERKYVQVWNPEEEEWQDKPSNNPAWACYDVLHNERYGGDVDVSRLNYDEFAAWADFCTEKGYEVNIYFDAEQSIVGALNTLSTLGRAIVVQRGTNFGIIIEKQAEAVQMFTVGNIVADSFNEKFLELKDRANVLEVSYFDKDYEYKKQVLEIRHKDYDYTKYAINRNQVTLYGCVDRQMAADYGTYLLNQNRYLTRTVEFIADIDSIACTVGDVIYVQHDMTEWGQGGRIVAGSESGVVLDQEVTLEANKDYRILIRFNSPHGDVLETAPLTPVTKVTNTSAVTIDGVFAHGVPPDDAIYSIGEVNKEAKRFRVLSLTRSQDLTRKITAIEYFDEMYDDTADLEQLVQQTALAPVKALTCHETWQMGPDGSGQSVVALSWAGEAFSWNVYSRKKGSTQWTGHGATRTPRLSVPGLIAPSTYELCVSDGPPNDGQIVSITLKGKDADPSDVTGFAAVFDQGRVRFKWNHIPDIDLWGYEIRYGMDWAHSEKAVDGVQENSALWRPPADGTYTFWIKARDTSGHYSESAAKALLTVDVEGELNVVRDQDEFDFDTPLPGLKVDCKYDTSRNVLLNFGSMTPADVPDALPDDFEWKYYAPSATGTIEYWSPIYSLGRQTNATMRVFTEVDAVLLNATDIDLTGRLDTTYPDDTDQHVTSETTVEAFYRTSDDGETWADWKQYDKMFEVTCTYYQFRWVATPDSLLAKITFDSLRHIADVPDVSTVAYNQEIEAGGTTFLLKDLGIELGIVLFVGVNNLGTLPLSTSVEKIYDGPKPIGFTVYLHQDTVSVAGTVDLQIKGY